MPRFARLHLAIPHVQGPGNIWALLLAAVIGIAMLVGLWMSGSPALHPSNIAPL